MIGQGRNMGQIHQKGCWPVCRQTNSMASIRCSDTARFEPGWGNTQTARHQRSFQSLHPHDHTSVLVHDSAVRWRGFAGDSRGICWGFSGDSQALRGIRHVFDDAWPTFWGDSPATTAVFYNFKKGKEDAWGVWAPMGLGYRGEAWPSVLKI